MKSSSWQLSAILLGIALGGFFDGILLHQILQWHHLLSLVPGMADLRLQILWDGVFHGVMYLLALAALWGLWRGRRAAERAIRTTGLLLIGFGIWHSLDAFLSHWLLGIHRIRPESAYPLAWDLGWLAAFGIAPLLLGFALMRRPPDGPSHRGGGWRPSLGGLSLLTIAAGFWALQPPSDRTLTAVVFAPWVPAASAAATLEEVGASVFWQDEAGTALVDLPKGSGWGLYAKGALMVGGAGMPEGCFSWSIVD